MNEPDFPFDDSLNRFERDLKSLTPRPFSSSSPVQTSLPLQNTKGISFPIAVINHEHQPSGLNSSNRVWLKTVAISWATGLAAGLLISAIWTKLLKDENTITDHNLVTENGSSAIENEPVAPTDVSDALSSTIPPGLETASLFKGQDFLRNSRSTALDSSKHQILHPFMALNNVHWNDTTTVSTKRLTGMRMGTDQNREQPVAPNPQSTSDRNILPDSSPKYQGQRQLLKSLMESDDLISI